MLSTSLKEPVNGFTITRSSRANYRGRSMSAVEELVTDRKSEMEDILARQKEAHIANGRVSTRTRIDRLDRSIDLLKRNKRKIIEALNEDFGVRCVHQSKLSEIDASVAPLKDAKKHISSWMKAEKRKTMTPLGLMGAKARVEFQPLGTVGVISPWNFPVNLTFTPLAGILSAGNRVMIKPSEFTPACSELMAEMFASSFDEEEIAVFTGGPEVGAAFSGLAFDHLLFTGATSIAKHVMRAASENLVPLTLELGGKSPVIVGRSASTSVVADRLLIGKTLNAGQICLAPDYVYVAEEKRDKLVAAIKKNISKMYPSMKDNDDYTSIINERHRSRLQSYIDDAQEKGAEVIQINPSNEDFSNQKHNKIPFTVVLDATEDMKVLQDEIFGPILPIKTYKRVSEAVDYINSRPRPLGLYYFGHDSKEERMILDNTTSGGVTINDVIMHIAQEDLPFGGVGPSGMGSYHGHDGFKTFSHKKAVFKQTKVDIATLAGMRAPFKK